MEKIESLNEMYDALESINYSNYSEIKSEINSFLKSTQEESIKKVIWCEHTCLEFRIIDAKIEGVFTIKEKDGNIISIPNLNDLNDDDFKYIEERINSVNNHFLKFRYAAILCNKSPHIDKAKICCDFSFDFIEDVEEEIIKNGNFDSFFVPTIINSYRFSFKFGYRKSRIKNKILGIINDENYWNNNLYLIPCKLINHVLDEKKNFKDVNNLNDVCWNIYENIKSSNPHGAIDVLELGEKTDSNTRTHNWRFEIAKMYENIMNEREEANVKAHFCILASENYKKAGKEAESEELLKQYNEYSKDFEYFSHSEKIENYSEMMDGVFEYADSIVENNESYEILKYLANDPELTMYYDGSWDFVEKSKKDFPLLHAFPVNLRDENGFVIEHIESDDEKDNHAVMQYYSWGISIFYLPFITRIINTAYIKGKLSPKIILDFLKEESWIGLGEIPGVGKNPFFMMLVPIINEYFRQWELIHLYNIPQPHFTLTIDSLILKIEGMLKLVYGIDRVIKEPTGHGAFQDKSLDKLLKEKSDLISEDDYFFLKYLLIDKSGLNLRNKVAHSLMKKRDYYLGNANLLLLALLKICAFKLVYKKE